MRSCALCQKPFRSIQLGSAPQKARAAWTSELVHRPAVDGAEAPLAVEIES